MDATSNSAFKEDVNSLSVDLAEFGYVIDEFIDEEINGELHPNYRLEYDADTNIHKALLNEGLSDEQTVALLGRVWDELPTVNEAHHVLDLYITSLTNVMKEIEDGFRGRFVNHQRLTGVSEQFTKLADRVKAFGLKYPKTSVLQ